MRSFEAALKANDLEVGDLYAINGTLAHALRWNCGKDSIRKKASRAFEPVNEAFARLSGITRVGRGNRLCATLETIVTKIFPLLVREHSRLQYYIDVWHRDHHQDGSTQQPRDNQSASPLTTRLTLDAASDEVTSVKKFIISLDSKMLKLKIHYPVIRRVDRTTLGVARFVRRNNGGNAF